MKIEAMKDVPRDVIENWIKTVNAEYGLTERNRFTISYIDSIRDESIFIYDEDKYAVLTPCPDLWGNKEIVVVSFYIRPEKRSLKTLNELQNVIEQTARENGAKYINEGSHFEPRLHLYLQYRGFEVANLRKEL